MMRQVVIISSLAILAAFVAAARLWRRGPISSVATDEQKAKRISDIYALARAKILELRRERGQIVARYARKIDEAKVAELKKTISDL